MTCTTTQDCPSYATCCDGSNEGCDGTRLPAGDGTNSGQFVVSTDGLTVTDTITGLVWQRDGSGARAGCAKGATCTWAEAKVYCAELVLAGGLGWRLPARMELLTIVDFTRTQPSSDPAAFPNTPSESFWTSSPYVGSSGYAWYVSFVFGDPEDGDYSGSQGVGKDYRVRCVR